MLYYSDMVCISIFIFTNTMIISCNVSPLLTLYDCVYPMRYTSDKCVKLSFGIDSTIFIRVDLV